MALLAAAVMAGGCSEHSTDEPPVDPGNTPSTSAGYPGKEIVFAGSTEGSSRSLSRTAYDGYDAASRFNIHWTSGDLIRIYSPDVNKKIAADPTFTPPSTQVGTYEVDVPHADDSPYHNTITWSALDRLYWSDGQPQGYWGGTNTDDSETGYHRFFAAYPDGRVLGAPTLEEVRGDAIYRMEYWTNQICTITDASTVNTGDSLIYYAEPNMKNAYMMAMKEVKYNEDHVLLDFDPIMTTLDIKVTAGGFEVPTGVVAYHRVTGVSVIMPRGMVRGEIQYNLKNGTAHAAGGINNSRPEEGAGFLVEDSYDAYTESVFVGIYDDRTGNHYVDLCEGESVSLMAFLPPIPQDLTEGVKIRVHTTGAFEYTKTLPGTLLQQSRVDIKLPKVNPFDTQTVNLWMAQLDDDIPVAQLCIPGDKVSYWIPSSGNTTTSSQAQDKTTKLLNQGVRAFDIRGTDDDRWGDIFQAIVDFLDDNPTEFVFVFDNRDTSGDLFHIPYQNRNIIKGDYLWDISSSTEKTVGNLRKHIIYVSASHELSGVHYYWYSVYFKSGSTWTRVQADNYVVVDNALETASNSYVSFDFDADASKLTFRPIRENGDSTFDVYKIIGVNGLTCGTAKEIQTGGRTGIVMLPQAGVESVYGDVLLQTLIDCNFKFHYRPF